MKFQLKRITSSGNFIPEIDGLRFLAISSVVLYHFWMFFHQKDFHSYSGVKNYPVLSALLSHGDFGVPFFFVISACVLGILFAKKPGFSMKHYFLRRITRIEPPYFISVSLLFLGIVYVAKIATFQEQWPKYLSSLAYISNFMYPQAHVNGVTWSLEIEVQFYLIAPMMAMVFRIRNKTFRRTLLLFAAIASLLMQYYISPGFISIANYFHFFLIGFLIADWYVFGLKCFPVTKMDHALSLLFFALLWVYEKEDFGSVANQFLWESAQLIFLALFFYYALIHKALPILKKPWVTNIGGMCYSIYLLHFYLISLLGNAVLAYQFSDNKLINIGICLLLILVPMSLICLAFYIFVERPCMDHDWPKKLLKRIGIKKSEGKTDLSI